MQRSSLYTSGLQGEGGGRGGEGREGRRERGKEEGGGGGGRTENEVSKEVVRAYPEAAT